MLLMWFVQAIMWRCQNIEVYDSMPKSRMPNDSMPKRDYAKWLYAKKGLCQKAVCQKTVCQMTLCQMTVCQLTVCQKAVCQKAVCQKAVCQMTVCQFTAQPSIQSEIFVKSFINNRKCVVSDSTKYGKTRIDKFWQFQTEIDKFRQRFTGLDIKRQVEKRTYRHTKWSTIFHEQLRRFFSLSTMFL